MSQTPPDIEAVAKNLKDLALAHRKLKPGLRLDNDRVAVVYERLAGALADIDRRLKEIERRDQT